VYLSIVIPTLNEAPHITELLRDLTAARTRGAEVIVVDGGSSDATAKVAAAHADRVIHAPRGRAAQLNAGAAHAAGALLLFLHADCRVPADLDLVLKNALADRPVAWGRFDVRIASKRRSLRVVGTMMNWRSRMSGIATGDQGIFVTRALFGQAGGFPQQPIMEDIALSRTLKRLAKPVCLRCAITTSGRRWERRGVLRTVWLMWRMRLAYYLGADPAKLAGYYEHVR
jgi:rSAM/selenodomain-associated transferase 2